MQINNISPKIALIYDHNHLDPSEIALSARLEEIKPHEKIYTFSECRYFETSNQYSVELLAKDKTISTATAAILLIGHMLTASNPDSVRTILKCIYEDPYFKKLFMEGHYKRYNPEKWGLPAGRWSKPFDNMQPRWIMAIENIQGLYHFLDRNLPLQTVEERNGFFEYHIASAAQFIIESPLCDFTIFGAISEALALIKIDQVRKKIGESLDRTKELTTSLLTRLYGGPDTTGELVLELNKQYRTQFHAEKVIQVVEKLFNKDRESIFVVRVGMMHRELMTRRLTEHFFLGDIKELDIGPEDLAHIERKIKREFPSLPS